MAERLRIGIMAHDDFGIDLSQSDYLGPDEIFFAPLMRAILTTYRDEPIDLRVLRATPERYLTMYDENKLDGMLIHMVSLDDLPKLRALSQAGVKYVAIGVSGSRPGDRELPCLDCDNRESGHLAADYLLSLGHQSFGCVNLASYYINHSDRMQGFMERVAEAGYPVEEECLLTNPGYECILFPTYANGWVHRLQVSGQMPTAIFTCDYNMAEATIAALHGNGIAVPEDVSLMAFDDPPWAASNTPPLTTMRQPVAEMGIRAATRLLEGLRSPERSMGATEIMRIELVVRESTALAKGRQLVTR